MKNPNRTDINNPEILAKALFIDEQTPALEKVLIVDQAKVKRDKIMIGFYEKYNSAIALVLILIFIGVIILNILNIFDITNVISIFIKNSTGAKIITAVLSIALYWIFVVVVSILTVKESTLIKKINSIKKKNDIYNKNFEIFMDILNKMDISQMPYYNGFFNKDSNLSARLFNLVNIYAMESFLEAGRQKDDIALQSLVAPFMEKILEDVVEDYLKKQELENEMANIEKQRLKSQIELDIAVFNKNK